MSGKSFFKYLIVAVICVNLLLLISCPACFGIIFVISLISFLIYMISKNTNNKIKNNQIPNKHELLQVRYESIINFCQNEIQASDDLYCVDNKIKECIAKIARRERRSDLVPRDEESLLFWEERKDITNEMLDLEKYIKDRFQKKYAAIVAVIEEERRKNGLLFFNQNKDLIDKFLEIAERKISVIDDYGDENWDALSIEIDGCILKIAKRNGEDCDAVKRFLKEGCSLCLRDEYAWLKEELVKTFSEYHNERKKHVSNLANTGNLNGIEFESYIAKVLKINGFDDVRGTPATGDQGADLIIKKNGKTIIVQAKKYTGSVGNKAIQEVIAAMNYYKGDEGWVITNSTFTNSAKDLAYKSGIKLIDGKNFEKMFGI